MKKISLFIRLLSFTFISFIIMICGLYIYAFLTPKENIKTTNKYLIYDYQNSLILQGNEDKIWVDIEDISPIFLDAVVSIEDKRFYSHQGFDYLRIVKALYKIVKNNKISEGASTISQQYIKNMYLDFEKTWSRKIEEAFLTLELEVHYSKDQILEGYLNTINYGNGNYGIEAASQYYFNKKAKDLNINEAVILAGIPKSPNNYNPVNNPEKALKRAKTVASAMLKNKKITKQEYDDINYDVVIYGEKETNNLKTIMYYQDAVLNELETIDTIPKSLLNSGGLKIFTSYNATAQEALDKSIKTYMSDTDMQVASVVIDTKTGGIMALAGGKDYATSQYNRVTKSSRQVGSTMKPILYYGALENGMTAASTFKSEPASFVFDNNKTYAPTNFNQTYANNDITMASAIAYSDNIYAVKTHLFLGEDVLINTAKNLGINKSLPLNPSLALGSSEINILDFAQAYQTLANMGYQEDIHLIKKIEDLEGNILYEKKSLPKLVTNQNYNYILNELLTCTYNANLKNYSTPTGLAIAGKMSRKYAFKSGSTDTDYWSVGYNPNTLILVWNGFDKGENVNIKEAIKSKQIWIDTMESIENDKDAVWYELPKNVVALPLNGITGKNDKNNNILFYFLKGTESTIDY